MKYSSIGGFFLLCALLCPVIAKADQCDTAYKQLDSAYGNYAREVAKYVFGDSCAFHKMLLRHNQNVIPLKRQAEMACGKRLTQKCDSACYQRGLAKDAADVEKACKPKVEIAPPVVSVPLPAPVPAAPQTSATTNRPASAPSAQVPRTTSKADRDCSDVSGTGGPRLQCSTTTFPKVGLNCQGGGDCMAKSKWSAAKPYNQGTEPVAFSQFRGPTVVIPTGHSLWSVKDQYSPTRRVLVARPWSGDSKRGTAPGIADCMQEGSNATTVDFEVSLTCETNRQLELQEKFEHREDLNPFMDADACRSPRTLKMNPDWEKRSLEYWKANPDEPVGWCFIPARDNREDVRKVREPNWLTTQDCERARHEALLRNAPFVVITVNKRGVRGCRAPSQ